MASQLAAAMEPPLGTQPNFSNPPSLQQSNIVQHATCLIIIFMFISMRIYTRLRILKAALGIDDYFCILSYALDWTYSMLMVKACSEGLSRHMWDVPTIKVPEALKYLMLSTWVYMLTTGAVKLTFLFTYYSIFSMRSKVKLFIYLGIAFVTCLTLGLFFSTVFSCYPVQKAWNALLPGTCSDPTTLAWISAISSSVTDLYIWMLPIVPLWRLNLNLEKRLKLMVAFSFGLIACIASLVRLGMTHILQSSPDALYTTAAIGKWSALEIDIGIICSCLMLLPAFINYHIPETWRLYLSCRISRLSESNSGSWKLPRHRWSSENYWDVSGERDARITPTRKTTPSSQASIELVHQDRPSATHAQLMHDKQDK